MVIVKTWCFASGKTQLDLSFCCCFLDCFLTVVGDKEKVNETVNVRTRDNKVHGERSVEATIERLQELKRTRVKQAEEDF